MAKTPNKKAEEAEEKNTPPVITKQSKKTEKREHADRSPREKIEHSLGLHVPFPRRIAPAQRPKVGLLALLVIGSNVLLWFFYHTLLHLGSDHTRFDILFWTIGSFCLFFLSIALVGIVALLVHERIIARSILLLAAFSYLAWFHLGWYSFVSVFLIILGMWQYDWQVKEEESLRVKFSVNKSMRHGLTLMIALCLLAVSLTFYANTIRKSGTATTSLDPITELAGNTTNQILALQVPGFNPKETLDEFLLRLANEQIQKSAGDSKSVIDNASPLDAVDIKNPEDVINSISESDLTALIAALPPDVRAEAEKDPQRLHDMLEQGNMTITQELAKTRQQLLSQFELTADGTTPMGEIVKQLISVQLNKILGPYTYFIPPLLALTIFFTLSLFTFLYAFCIKLLAVCIFFLFRITQFTRIRTITTEVEVATLGE